MKAHRLTGVRQEIKYLLSPSDWRNIKDAVAKKITPKIVNSSDHSWRISVYLDSADYFLLKKGLKRGSQTTKLRVKRYYQLKNGKPVFDDTCWLEVKTRAGSMVEKSRFKTSSSQVLVTLENGPVISGDDADMMACRNFENMRKGKKLIPVFVAHYRRYTFEDKESRTRITIDDHVSYHAPPRGIFTEAVPICTRNLLPPPLKVENNIIMEVKSTGLAPLWINKILNDAAPVEYSKFVTGIHAVIDNKLLTF
jgi:hypothetical protein